MNWRILFIFAWLIPSIAHAESTVTIGAEDVLSRVLGDAPQTLIAREELGEVEALLMSSKSMFDTQLTLDANHTRDESKRSSTFFGTRQDMTNWNLGVARKFASGTSASIDWTNQRSKLFGSPVINGASIFPTDATFESILQFSVSQSLLKNVIGMNDRAVVNQARKAFAAADYGTKYRIASIAQGVLSLYWQWVIASKNVSSWESSVSDAKSFLNITNKRKSLGTAEKSDVLAAQANLLNRENGLAGANILKEQLEKELRVLLAYDSETNLEPKDESPHFIHEEIPTREDAVTTALSRRWDYLAQKAEVERQNITLVAAKNKRWPELDVFGTFSLNDITTSYASTVKDIDSPAWTVGMGLSFPLENRGARAEAKQARHGKAKAIFQLKELENDIANSVSELVSRLNTNIEILKNAEQAEKLQKEKLRQELGKYQIGRSSSELIIRYQDDRLMSEQSALSAWENYINTVLGLKLAENVLIDL